MIGLSVVLALPQEVTMASNPSSQRTHQMPRLSHVTHHVHTNFQPAAVTWFKKVKKQQSAVTLTAQKCCPQNQGLLSAGTSPEPQEGWHFSHVFTENYRVTSPRTVPVRIPTCGVHHYTMCASLRAVRIPKWCAHPHTLCASPHAVCIHPHCAHPHTLCASPYTLCIPTPCTPSLLTKQCFYHYGTYACKEK